jgi:hypothetical protein
VGVEKGESGAGVPEVEGDYLVAPLCVDEQDVHGVVPRHAGGDEAAGGLVLPDGVGRRLRREEGEPRRETGHRAPRKHRRKRSLIDKRQCGCSEEDALSSPLPYNPAPTSECTKNVGFASLLVQMNRTPSGTAKCFGILWDHSSQGSSPRESKAATFGLFSAKIDFAEQTFRVERIKLYGGKLSASN